MEALRLCANKMYGDLADGLEKTKDKEIGASHLWCSIEQLY